jgi:hypothetical protein
MQHVAGIEGKEGPDRSYNDIAAWARTGPMEISRWYDQTHADAKIERIDGFRGDEEDEPKKVKDSRKPLNRTRKQMRTDGLSDNDDVYGLG